MENRESDHWNVKQHPYILISLYPYILISLYPYTMLCHLSCDFNYEFMPRINIKNFRPSVWYTLANILKNSWDLSMASLPFSSQPPMWSLRNFCTCYYEVNNLTWITCITVLMHFELWELKYAYYIRMMFKYFLYQISLNGDVHFFSTEFF